MKSILLLSTAAALALSTGCASHDKISADVRASVAAQNATTSEERRAAAILAESKKDARLREAYSIGQLQATKALYQAIQNTQNSDTAAADRAPGALVPLTVPERSVDGVIVNPSVEYVRLPN